MGSTPTSGTRFTLRTPYAALSVVQRCPVWVQRGCSEVLALFRDRMADFAILFKEQHPEAVLREVEEDA